MVKIDLTCILQVKISQGRAWSQINTALWRDPVKSCRLSLNVSTDDYNLQCVPVELTPKLNLHEYNSTKHRIILAELIAIYLTPTVQISTKSTALLLGYKSFKSGTLKLQFPSL